MIGLAENTGASERVITEIHLGLGRQWKSLPWVVPHVDAWAQRSGNPRELAAGAVAAAVTAWARYADAHYALYDNRIGDDAVIGEGWKSWGKSLLGLLNGETGKLDCGTVDKMIREIAELNGVELDS